MGQLKSGILALQKTLVETEPNIAKLGTTAVDYDDRIKELGSKAAQGYDAIRLYLIAKFQKSGSNIQAQAARKLKDIMDGNIQDLIKGMIQWQGDLKSMIARQNNDLKSAADGLLAVINQAHTQAGQLRQLAEKKKAKLFKSAKYKDKIKSYLAAIDSVDDIVSKLKASVGQESKPMVSDKWVDNNFRISPDMTVAQIVQLSSATLGDNLKNYEENRQQINMRVRRFRDEYKSIPGQLNVMKKWIDEADQMEKEAEAV